MEALNGIGLEEGKQIDGAQIEAVKEAKTVGDFVNEFRAKGRELIEGGTVEQSEVEERLAVVEVAAKGSSDLKLGNLEANVLGQALVGGGDGSITLSRDLFSSVREEADIERAQHVAAHEGAHAEQVRLHGTLTMNGREVDHLLILEGDAELAGNEAVGKKINAHREGQPEAIYREGQDIVIEIVQRVGREKFREVLRSTGDLYALQEALAA